MGQIEAEYSSFKQATKTALELSAVFTEFKRGTPEWNQPLVNAFGGKGTSDEPKLVWMCHDAGLSRSRFDQLVQQLYHEGFICEFLADESAREMLCWATLRSPCWQLVQRERERRLERERIEREFQDRATAKDLEALGADELERLLEWPLAS